jgi:hypothetical protein
MKRLQGRQGIRLSSTRYSDILIILLVHTSHLCIYIQLSVGGWLGDGD